MKEHNIIPQHIAIIMDGNGRWAKKRLLPRAAGHRAGSEAVKRTIEAAIDHGVNVLTLFAFSSENWARPTEEVDQLMDMFVKGLKKDAPRLLARGVRLRFIGDLKALKPELQQKIQEVETSSETNTELQLVIAVNYGGQWDILNAAKKMHQNLLASKITIDEVDVNLFSSYLSTADLPPPDLFIRTSGEIRISNFLLWQLAYTELYFTELCWPDFNAEEFAKALMEFAKRQRRFGAV